MDLGDRYPFHRDLPAFDLGRESFDRERPKHHEHRDDDPDERHAAVRSGSFIDLPRARACYGGVLRLELVEEGGEESVLTYRTGSS